MHTSRYPKAAVIIYTLIIISAASVILFGLVHLVVVQTRYSLNLEPKEESLHIAEAGVYFYRWYLAHNIDGKTDAEIATFWAGTPLGTDDNGDGDCDDADTADGDGDGTEAYVAPYASVGSYKICITPPGEAQNSITIDAWGWTTARPGTVRHIRARLRKPSWSEFIVLGNAAMRLSEETEIFGQTHVNGGFRFDGVAHNIVTSSVESYDDPDTWWYDEKPGVWTNWADEYNDTLESNVFLAGKEYPVIQKDFNSVTTNFTLIKSWADAHGTSYGAAGKGRLIELGQPTSGQMRITRVKQYNTDTFDITKLKSSDVDIQDIPDFGAIYVKDNIWIEGELPDGKQLTIASHHPGEGKNPTIFLGADDVTQANPEGSSVLGIVAEGDIQFIKNSEGDLGAPSGSDEETLEIDAALLAQKGRIGREYWANNYKDTLRLFGALASNTRMGFGYTDGTGFQNRTLIFDARLLDTPPPFFPSGDSYAIDAWQEIR